jgi:sugar O-acyltransferase (sialic acid O-acetyltransferase NeuD family)
MTTRRLLIYGAGGHGKVVADVGRAAGFEIAGFIDDDPARCSDRIWGLPVLAWEHVSAGSSASRDAVIVLGIGDNRAREVCRARIAERGMSAATLVHPSAVVAPSARLGVGVVVMALAAVNPDAVVGDGVILNTGCVVEHDCRLGSFSHLSPNSALGGEVRIGDRTHLGLGAVVLPGVTVGADVRVGAGAVVHRDVPNGSTVVGVPARPLSGMRGKDSDR